jgi:hypothetical protein
MIMGFCRTGIAQNVNIVTIGHDFNDEIIVTIDPQIHIDYGVAYPLTYEFSIPNNLSGLLAYKRYSANEGWTPFEEKTSAEFFNAIEAVRFEYDSNRVFLSAGFADSTDTLFLKITDSFYQNIPITFNQICKYYDNRDAAVICSADDYADWNLNNFLTTMQNFRNQRLWLSVGVNSGICSQATFNLLQQELDAGYIEASAHGRTHAQGPYNDPYDEIVGCKNDLINFLDMPPLFRSGDNEYVYLWIGPYGYNDDIVESLLGQHNFLANRLYYDFVGTDSFPDWDDQYGLYHPFGVTRELGPVMQYFIGTGDSTDLNNAFDNAVSSGGVYHVMCHPSIIEWNEAYTWSHLNHISNLNHIWYASVGQAFVYHFAQENYQQITTSVAANEPIITAEFSLSQNYPNPFNPKTTIEYTLQNSAHVELSIFNINGREIKKLVNKNQNSGTYFISFDASDLASGIYIYRLRTGSFEESLKMILLQ